MNNQDVKIGVIGVGHLGQHHARLLAEIEGAQLVGICDVNESSRELAEKYSVPFYQDYRELEGKVDAVTVVVPTFLHHEVARFFLERNVHTFIEKPCTKTLDEANDLVSLAGKKQLTLQVGHVERFNAAILKLQSLCDSPRFIECQRMGPFSPRIQDVGVVQDLMIHDIDMIIGLVGSPVSSVDAVGTGVMGRKIDIANARINFESGCVANVTSSRISYKTERRLRVFSHSQYLNCDLGERKIFGYSLRGDPTTEGLGAIATDTVDIPQEDSLGNEIASFLDCVKNGKKPFVDGYAGSEALRVAVMINESIDAQLRKVRSWLVPGDSVTVSAKS